MRKYKNRIEKYLQTERGRRFLNTTYSWGAAVVILGATFKVLHMPGGDWIFGLGMLTEVCIFILYGFDTPDDLSVTDEKSSYVPPVVYSGVPSGSSTGNLSSSNAGQTQTPSVAQAASSAGGGATFVGGTPTGGGTVFIGNFSGSPAPNAGVPVSGNRESEAHSAPPSGAWTGNVPPVYTHDNPVENIQTVSENVQKFADATATLTKISESLQASYQHIIDNSQNIGQNSLGYVQQMEALNRNISGLNTIYEIQLKSVSGQLDTIEQVNSGLNRIKTMFNETIPDGNVIKEETEKMAEQLRELNTVYARMLEAMTNSQRTS